MEALAVPATGAPIFPHPTLSNSSNSTNNRLISFITRNGYLLPSPVSHGNLSLRSPRSRSNSMAVVAAKKKNKNDSNKAASKKVDTHSIVPKPDEATGPFPEAVLLKEKKVQEDRKLLPEFADDEEREMFEYLTLKLESELKVGQMRHYEVVYLIHEDHKDEVDSINSKVQDFLREKKGKVWRFSDWGMRRLAYKIRKATHAHYILMNFELEAKWINDFKNMLDKDERVIRHLVIKRDRAITEVCIPPPEYHKLKDEMDDEYVYGDEDEDEEDYDDGDGDRDEEDDLDLNGEYDDAVDDGIILVNDYEHHDEMESYQKAVKSNKGQRTLKPRK